METYTITPAKPADAAAILDYLKQLGGETDNLSFGAEGLPFTVAEEKAYLAARESTRDCLMLLVKQGGQIIGDASVERLPRRMRHRGSIGISVLKAHWGRGIGSALMAQLIAFARENGFAQLELEVRSDNARAIRLYEKFGFQKLCTHPDFFRIGGQRFDFDLMLLPLD